MIVIKPIGGLANRLRVMASAYKLCNEINDRVAIIWDINSSVKCSFGKLFELKTDVLLVKNRCINEINKYTYTILNKLLYTEITQISKGSEVNSNHITTCHNFFDAHDYSFLMPSNRINDKVKCVFEGKENRNMIGVQIRRSDNKQSILMSPTELFIEKMNGEIERNPDVVFYLATDDMATRADLLKKYGDRIFYNPISEVRRDTETGIIDAAVDLISLSLCKKVYGSFYSSFCEVASDIGGGELLVVKE